MNPISSRSSLKFDYTKYILLLGYLTLLIFSLVYTLERCTYSDAAIYTYEVASTGKYYIATNRFVSVLGQLLLIAGVHLGLSLKVVMTLYSFNLVLFPILSGLICLYFFRDKSTALAILLFYTIMNAMLFFYPISEFQMGLCLLLLYHSCVLGFLNSNIIHKAVFIVFSLVLIPIVIFSHPLSSLVFVLWYIALWFMFDVNKNKFLLLPIIIATLSFLVKKYWFTTGLGLSYDQKNMDRLQLFSLPIKDYLNATLPKEALRMIENEYFIVPLIVAFTLGYFIYKRKWLAAFYSLLITLCFYILISVCYRDWNYVPYTEHLYQPMAFFIGLIFSSIVFKALKHQYIIATMLAIILIISFSKIKNNSVFFKKRLEVYSSFFKIMGQYHISNATMTADGILSYKREDYWSTDCETRLLSGYYDFNNQKEIFINGNKEAFNYRLSMQNPKYYFKNIPLPFYALDSIIKPTALRQMVLDVEHR
jgi:hypothetical protein